MKLNVACTAGKGLRRVSGTNPCCDEGKRFASLIPSLHGIACALILIYYHAAISSLCNLSGFPSRALEWERTKSPSRPGGSLIIHPFFPGNHGRQKRRSFFNHELSLVIHCGGREKRRSCLPSLLEFGLESRYPFVETAFS